jgi:hypothetical protein
VRSRHVSSGELSDAEIMPISSSSSSAPSRFITAFPNGNTGALVYFVPLNTSSSSSPLGTTLDLASVRSYSSTDNQTGLQGNISVSGDLTFGVTLSALT